MINVCFLFWELKMAINALQVKRMEPRVSEARPCPAVHRTPIFLGPTDGKLTIAQAGTVFGSFDTQFHGLDVASDATERVAAFICGRPRDMSCPCFSSREAKRPQLFWTQAQIVLLARDYPQQLPSDGYTLWLPFQAIGRSFFAGIYFGTLSKPEARCYAAVNQADLKSPNGRDWLAILRPDLATPVR